MPDDGWVDPRMGGVSPHWDRHRSSGAAVVVWIALSGCSPIARVGPCRGAVTAAAALASLRVALWLVPCLWVCQGDDGRNVWSPPVLDQVGKGVLWVGSPQGGVAPHVFEVVDVLGVSEHGDIDGSLVRWPVKAEAPPVTTVVVECGVVAGPTHESVTEAHVVGEWRWPIAILRVPVQHDIEPARGGRMHAVGDVLADGPDGNSVPVHVCDGHGVRPADDLVEEMVLLESGMWAEKDVTFLPQGLVGPWGFGHAGSREAGWPSGPIWQALFWDTTGARWPVPLALVARLSRLGLLGA